MRKAILLTLLSIAVAIPSLAVDRHQSYISYDDGGTVVRSGDDGRDVEAHRNLPIYPGDEVVTARRGRAEIRLSDGNVIGVDRATSLRFRSILDSYDGAADETVAELRYGKVAVYRTDLGRDHVRLDTPSASYVAQHEAIYSVETDSRGRDNITVFSGSVEVRTPSRAARIRAGQSATVDDRGLYDLVGDRRSSADDFERWFLRRAERLDGRSTSHVDRRLSYWADDLDDHGRWVNVTGIGWSWRPYVAVGWRPYYNGYWYHGRGALTWVSHDPWGWGTYHYGRWAYDRHYGWVWVPGHSYSPAWVYWWYGSGYVGWAPAGWWDCYRPYYNWAYQPYRARDFGFGFYGRVRVSEIDLTPWTFVDSRTIVSTRIDRAALTTDAIKHRLGRSDGGFATIASGPARFTREELPDPAEAIRRRGLDGRMTGRETGAPPNDLTPFFRRDENLGSVVRDRIISARGGSSAIAGGGSAPSRNAGGGEGSTRETVGRIGRGQSPTDGGATTAPSTGGIDRRGEGGRIDRGSPGGAVVPREPVRSIGGEPVAPRDGGQIDRGSGGSNWRDRIGDRGSSQPRPSEPAASPAPREGSQIDRGSGGSSSWRDRVGDRGTPAAGDPPASSAPPASQPAMSQPRQIPRPSDDWRGRIRSGDDSRSSTSPAEGERSGASSGSSAVPRRVIDRIGGARVYPSDRDRSSGSSTRDSSRSSAPPRESTRPSSPPRDSGSSSGARDSGGGSSRSGSSGARDSGGGSSRSGSSSGGNRESGGRIKRDQE